MHCYGTRTPAAHTQLEDTAVLVLHCSLQHRLQNHCILYCLVIYTHLFSRGGECVFAPQIQTKTCFKVVRWGNVRVGTYILLGLGLGIRALLNISYAETYTIDTNTLYIA